MKWKEEPLVQGLQIRDSLFMHHLIFTAEKTSTGGSTEKQIQLRKHFSHLLLHNTIKPFNGLGHSPAWIAKE